MRATAACICRDAWLREEGIDPDAWLAAPVWRPEIGRVVARLLREAEGLYRRAESGIGGLPALCRPGIFAARHIYAEIGVQIAQAALIRSRPARMCRARENCT